MGKGPLVILKTPYPKPEDVSESLGLPAKERKKVDRLVNRALPRSWSSPVFVKYKSRPRKKFSRKTRKRR